MPRRYLIFAVCLLCVLGGSGCSNPAPPDATASSQANPSLSLASKIGQRCEVDYGDQKETDNSSGTLLSVSDQWIALKDVATGQTVNGVPQTNEIWISASKVLSISFDPAVPAK